LAATLSQQGVCRKAGRRIKTHRQNKAISPAAAALF